MRYFNLLSLSLMMLGYGMTSHAEHLSLPAMSVEGAAAEETPYILPPHVISSNDTGDLVKRLPGANINKNGTLSTITQYRGLFGDRVNVVIDGVRISQAGPNQMDSPLSYLPSSRVANVSVYRGIAPVSTGIETIGGTITANSKKAEFGSGESFETHGNATAGYATNGNTRYAGITASAANESHRFQIAGSADRGNTLEFADGDIRPSQHERDTVGLSYGFQNSGHQLDIDLEHNDTGKTGTPALPMDIIFARGEHYKLNFGKDLNNGGKIRARINYQDTDHLMNNYQLRTKTDKSKHRYALTDVESAGFKLSYQQDNWTIGIDADQAKHNATVFNPNMTSFFLENYKDIERDRYSLFGEVKTQLASDWQAEFGGRYTLVSMDAADVSSSMMGGLATLATRFSNQDKSQDEHLIDIVAKVIHNLDQNLDFEFALARKERAPSYQERYLWATMESTSGLADGNNYVGDVNLDKETAYQVELGLDLHTAKAGLSPRIFYHHINDYIQGVASDDATVIAVSTMMGDATPLQFSNVDAKLYGFDANWFATISSNWQLDGTVSYVRGERRDTNDNLYRIAPLSARTMLSYVQTTWRVGFEAETVAAQNKVSVENEEQKTSGYALFHLSASYQPAQDVIITAGINNLFDRDYQDHLGGINRISDNPDIAQGERLHGLGRSGYVGVNVNW
ncbi:MAG: TonB-dependent receptor [Gammaproteobacteria bacterium]|nr:TonB-dependent receptor [Gammaproteobacteria bacterium]